jgi:hypothetical protein
MSGFIEELFELRLNNAEYFVNEGRKDDHDAP